MRILIFNWRDLKHSWAGGGEIYVFELAKRWVRAGHEVTVFCSQDVDEKLPEKEKYSGINIIRRGNRFTLYLWAFWAYITELRGKFDLVVDVENGIPFFTPLFVRIPKISFVYHVHGRQFFYELFFPINYIGYFIEKYVFAKLYSNVQVVAISATTKEDLVRLGFKKRNIHIVYCGIDGVGKYKNSIPKSSSPTLLYLGRIKAYKRVDLLVKLFGQILKSIPRAKLVIAGWGTEASSVVDIVMKSPYRRRIELLGPVSESEKRKLLSKSWLFVNLSIGEGWSISVIESNIHGTPAISFKVPGLSESIKHEITGVLVKSEEELIDKIIYILQNDKYRRKLSVNAKSWGNYFSWDKSASKTLVIMQKVSKNA